MIILSFNKEMNDLAVILNPAHHYFAVVVLQCRRLHESLAAALGRFLPRRSCILNGQCEHFHAVAVILMVLCDWMIRAHRRGQYKRDLVLTYRIAGAISHASLRT